MKGDFSRRTFDPLKLYSAVLQEQGRMLSDADLEEEHRIVARRIEAEAADLIGGCGGPIGDAGFAVTVAGNEIQIGAGRYYVDGLLVENIPAATATAIAFTGQPYRPGVTWPPAEGAGRYLVWLDVWRRLVTALDDAAIREVALGGPTTAAREQTVWQVRLDKVDATTTCATATPALAATTGMLAARADPEAAPTEPCEVPPTAGFKGLENQLYRVEVHDPGAAYNMSAATPADTFEITAFPAGTPNVVTLADGPLPAIGDAVEFYAQATPAASTFGYVTGVTGKDVTVGSPLPTIPVADKPRLRRVHATFVWSRDNGSVVTTIERIEGAKLTVHDLGPDDVLGFCPGQWVEIVDDRNEFERKPGQLLRIASVDLARRTVTLATTPQPLDTTPNGPGVAPALHPKLRRWDGAGAIRFGANATPDWLHLEDGIQVRFTDNTYLTGDYWHFPARTALLAPSDDRRVGDIEWPQEGNAPAPRLPHGIAHHACPLALVDLTAGANGTLTPAVISDCRDLFPPVTRLTNLLYVGGDGQEGVPDPTGQSTAGLVLPAKLQVRVVNGGVPVKDATVQFAIPAGGGNGQLEGTNPPGTGMTLKAQTGTDGIASCTWQLDPSTPAQRCEARLLDAASQPIAHQAVNFTATLSTASRVSYDPEKCPDLAQANVKTVQEAIDALCAREPGKGGGCCCVSIGPEGQFKRIEEAIQALRERKIFDICLCLMPGEHGIGELVLESREIEPVWNLSITGCGPGTRLDLEKILRVRGFNSVTLRKLDIAARPGAMIEADQCRTVEIDECRISGRLPESALVRISFASRVHVGNCVLESLLDEVLGPAIEFLDVVPELGDLYRIDFWRDFERAARERARAIAEHDPGERAIWAKDIETRIGDIAASNPGGLSTGEAAAYRRLARTLAVTEVDPLALLDHLIAIRQAVARLNPGIALVIGDLLRDDERPSVGGTRDGAVVIENNDITGVVSFYGHPAMGEDFEEGFLADLSGTLRGQDFGTFGGLGQSVHIRDNRVTRLRIGAELMEAIRRIFDGGRIELDALFASLHCTDNIIDGAISQIVTRHVSLAHNEFTLSAVRGGAENDQGRRIADVIADSAVYTGNHAQRAGLGVFFNSRIWNVTRASAEAATLEITFVS